MIMGEYFKLIGLLLALLGMAVLLRQKSSTVAIGFTVAVCLLCMAVILPQIVSIWAAIEEMLSACGLDMALFAPLMKVVGISICTRIVAEMCRDAGERAFGVKVELAGAAAALLCALPLAQKVLKLITGVTS